MVSYGWQVHNNHLKRMGQILTWFHFALAYLSRGSDFYDIEPFEGSGII